MNWRDYQEQTASFFRSLGLDAETDVSIQGVRTKHDIDVLVISHHVGFKVTWIVECKYWSSKVSKLHVLALREIVSDTGADRGILLAENGYQSGAIEAATLTNVQLTSISKLKVTASHSINSMKLNELFDRLKSCKDEYWNIPKQIRIEYGLRPDTLAVGYSGDIAIEAGEKLVSQGLRGEYPIQPDKYHALISKTVIGRQFPKTIDNVNSLVEVVTSIVENLEEKINECKSKIGKKT